MNLFIPRHGDPPGRLASCHPGSGKAPIGQRGNVSLRISKPRLDLPDPNARPRFRQDAIDPIESRDGQSVKSLRYRVGGGGVTV